VPFLYGDSTPTPFDTNFLEDLRDAMDFAAAIAEADQQIVTAAARGDALQAGAEAETARLQALVHAMLAGAASADRGEEGSATARLTSELARIVSERHEAAGESVAQRLAEDIRALEAATLAARGRYPAILERWVLVRNPPDASCSLRLEAVAQGKDKDEHGYVAELIGRSDLGLDWSIEMAIPEGSPWSKLLRVDRIADGLAILAPQMTGLIKKEVKRKKQKLERHFVTKLVDDGTTVRVELRAEIGEPAGFDISVDLGERLVTAARTGDDGDAPVGPFATAAEDRETLIELAAKLRASARELPKRRLVAAALDDLPFDGTNPDAQPTLVQIVSRLVAKLAPTVNEISARSRAEDELVLRRGLADGHREEIFLQKATLRDKLAPLDGPHRALFSLLELDAAPRREAARAEQPPASVRSEVPPSVPDLLAAAAVAPEPEPAPEPLPEPAPPATIPPASTTKTLPPNSRNGELVATLKHIRAMTKDGRIGEAYRQYATLFTSATFLACRPEDQRQALKLMIFAKTPAQATDEVRDAHRAAIAALQPLVLEHREPADYEMLGMAYVAVDQPEKATEVFKKALEIERVRNPASDLCGNLMRRVSQL
jgi:hypothetical protein